MTLIDIGVNLMDRAFSQDREAVVTRASQQGLTALILTGTDVNNSKSAAEYCDDYNGRRKTPISLYSTAGTHPHNAKNCGPSTIDALRAIAYSGSVKAIGECGLDYNRDFSPRSAQRLWFEKQIELAAELGLPLFLHERDAFEDFSAILRAMGSRLPPAVVHCFTGGARELETYLALGCYIGVTGWICDERRGADLYALAAKIPPERLMLETDAPYLIPRKVPESLSAELKTDIKRAGRGRNESAYLPCVAASVAESRGVPAEQVARESSAAARRFFSLE